MTAPTPTSAANGPARQRIRAGAAVLGDRAGTVIDDAVLDVADGRITWVGPAADAPAADPGVPD
ncbi:MAG: hypothetical protein ACR2KN_07900, partial [Geodermatophilaceae bacterium]